MEKIEFMIKFITPLLIHGAESRETDSIGLTGKALRGCWRFWFRALVGGMVKNISKGELLKLEGNIFGSSDELIGAKFKMVVTPEGNLKPRGDIDPGFVANFKFSGFPEGSKFLISILTRKNMNKEEIKVLLATIWLWANLGGIGQRARRGFGSPVIIIINKENNPFNFNEMKLPIEQDFSSPSDLEGHLKVGLKKVWEIFNGWKEIKEINKLALNPSIDDKESQVPIQALYFILQSFKQIYVSQKGFSSLSKGISYAHGSDRCKGLGWTDNRWMASLFPHERTKSSSRMASPVYTRFHKVNNEFLPVITWCKQKIIVTTEDKSGKKYQRNLTVPEKQCLESYLKGEVCRHGVSFPGLGCSNYLSWDSTYEQ